MRIKHNRSYRGGARGLTGAWISGKGGPIGGAWQATPVSWPGRMSGGPAGATVSNHYGLSQYGASCPGGQNPYFGMSSATGSATMAGGRGTRRGPLRGRRGGHRSCGRRQNGGFGMSSFFPQPVLNAWRGITGNVWDTAYNYSGLSAPASNNPDPTVQPIDRESEYIGGIPTDVPSITQFADEAVAKLNTK
jgi:hypothetical protein